MPAEWKPWKNWCGRKSCSVSARTEWPGSAWAPRRAGSKLAARSLTASLAASLLGAGLLLAPGAQASEVRDPWQGFNRGIFAVNDRLDRWLLRPVAKGYDVLLPDPVQNRVNNVFRNLGEPGTALNQFLQGKPRRGFSDIGRFLINSTLGIAGLFDVATVAGLREHNEDFGQTFEVWGIGRGPYLEVPFRGPSTTTNAVAMMFDALTNPLSYLNPERDRYIAYGVSIIDLRASLLDADKLVTGDRYLFLRDAYWQRRDFLVNDGVTEEDPFLDDFDEEWDEDLDEQDEAASAGAESDESDALE